MSSRANTDSETALDKLFELAVRLTQAMQRGLADRGLSPSRAEVLLVLEARGALVQRELSQALRCTPRYVTALIDALEGEGLVRRSAHPTDRRATLVSLTEGGSAAAARMSSERRQAARWLLGDIPDADLRTFVAVTDRVLERIATAPPPPADPEQRRVGAGGASRSQKRGSRPGSPRTSSPRTSSTRSSSARLSGKKEQR